MRFLLLIMFFPLGIIAQIGMDQWRLHVPNKRAIDIVSDGNVIYTAFDNGVLEHDIASNESSLWDIVTGLSDITVSCLGYDPASNSVFIGYVNGNIDQLKESTVTNIPGIVLAQLQGDNTIYKIVSYNNFVYCATGFGIVKIDPSKNEIKDTYYPSNGIEPILDVAFKGDSIFALSENKVYRGFTQSPALADVAQWSVDARVPVLATTNFSYKEIEVINEELYIQKNTNVFSLDSVFRVTNASLVFASPTVGFDVEIEGIGMVENRLAVFSQGIAIIYNMNGTYYQVINLYGFASNANPNRVVKVDGNYWVADNTYGLIKYVNGGNSEKFGFEGPPRNEFFAMDWYNGILAVVPGGIKEITPVYTPPGIYYFEDEVWTSKSRDDQLLWQGVPAHDNLSVSINPKDKNQVASGTFSEYGLSLINMDGAVTDTFTQYNSTLTPYGPGWYYLSDVKFDDDGNLWVLNSNTTEPLKLRTSEGTWHSFSIGTTAINKQTRRMVIDNNNNIWMSVVNTGLSGYSPGEDITDPSDDKNVKLTTGEGAGNLPSKEVTALAVDADNEIWIGTNNGFAVLYNSQGAFDETSGNPEAQRIKLDFEGNVEYVLGETYITDIEVDGGNRKWMGTSGAGVILLSPDGLEILKQFNEENSPLISNNIIDMEIDQNTGELFIITDKGLVSYRSDASRGTSNYDNVQIFPNPARPEYDGPITIQGIKEDSDVRITDVAGNLVYKTTSNGGTATWNGLTINGEPVSTGVYLIWTAPNEGKGRYVGKVLVAN